MTFSDTTANIQCIVAKIRHKRCQHFTLHARWHESCAKRNHHVKQNSREI